MNRTHILAAILFFVVIVSRSQEIYVTANGIASFVSNAPLEVIKASSDQVEGAINLSDRSLVFTINNKMEFNVSMPNNIINILHLNYHRSNSVIKTFLSNI